MKIGSKELDLDTANWEVVMGQNVLKALAIVVFNNANKAEIPIKLKNGMSYKITVKEDAE